MIEQKSIKTDGVGAMKPKAGHIVLALFVGLQSFVAAAQQRDDFFAGKTITFVNNFPPGGASDLWTRLNARHIGKFIPGNPVVNVQNRGGAAGKIGYGWFATQAPADGTSVGMFGGALPQEQAFGEMPRDLPSISELQILASVGDTDVFFARRAKLPEGARSMAKPPEPPVAVAQESDVVGRLLTAQFGLLGLAEGRDYKMVRGFPGGSEILLAMRRGEIDFDVARVGLYRQAAAPEVAAGAWTVLWQGGVARGGVIRRNAAIPDIPTFEEAFQTIFGAPPTGPQARFVRWHARAQGVTRFAALPRGAPARAKEILIDSWRRMASDEEFLREADKTLGIGPDAMLFAEEARRAIADVLAGPNAEAPE